MRRPLILSLTLLCLGVCARVYGDPIPGIFSTGVNNSGVVLAPGTADGHYLSGAFATNPDPAWTAAPAGTSWITHFNGAGVGGPNSPVNDPNAPPAPGGTPQTTTFTMNFDLTGFDKNTAQLALNFMVDNTVNIRVNGTSIFNNGTASNALFYTVLQGLVNVPNALMNATTNTLTFTVRNNEFIEGLLVQIVTNNVSRPQQAPPVVPEPTSIALWGLVTGAGVFASRWNRRKA
jgi:hypothetical protein